MGARKIIKDYLLKVRNECLYKIAFTPRGWVWVNIERVSKDLAAELNRKGKK